MNEFFLYGECIFTSKMCNMLFNSLLWKKKAKKIAYWSEMWIVISCENHGEGEHCHGNWSVKVFWRFLGALMMLFWFFFPFSITRGSYTELLYQEIHISMYQEIHITILNYYRKFINSLTKVFSVGEKQSKTKQTVISAKDLRMCLKHVTVLAELIPKDGSWQALSLLWSWTGKWFLHSVNCFGTNKRQDKQVSSVSFSTWNYGCLYFLAENGCVLGISSEVFEVWKILF